MRQIRREVEGWLYILPTLIFLLVFLIYPMLRTFVLSVYMSDSQGKMDAFIGLQHYFTLFKSDLFYKSLLVTIQFVCITVPLTLLLALALALLSHRKMAGIGFFRMIFASSMGMSVAAAAVIWMFMYNPAIGILNRMITAFGLSEVQWLLNPETALLCVAVTSVWCNVGFAYLILLGGIQNIDQTLYESADIAGVKKWQQITRITLPLLSPTLFFLFIVSIIGSFQTFGQIDILTKGGPTDTTNVIVYSIYKNAYVNFDIGIASAQSMVLFLIIFALTWLQFKVGERKVHYQ
ncbi:MAG: carbohydrate ABC transporter permease [Bacilli bacterium]